MRYQQLLNELKIINRSDMDEESSHLIFNTTTGEVLIANGDIFEEKPDEAMDFFGDYYDDDMDIHDVLEIIQNEKTPFQYFRIEDNRIEIDDISGTVPDSILNRNIQKIIKEFDLDGVSYVDGMYDDEGNEYETPQHVDREVIINANVKNSVFYHGTSYHAFEKIIKRGLSPTRGTNFKNINHDDKIFITSRISKAAFHAITAAKKDNSTPVILKVKVPDINKLVLDYDVAVQEYGVDHPLVVKLGYDLIDDAHLGGKMDSDERQEWKKLADRNSINTKTGVFGYQGRIPATYIKSFYIDVPTTIEMEEMGEMFISTAESMKNALDQEFHSVKEFDDYYENIQNELFPEDDEDEDEDDL